MRTRKGFTLGFTLIELLVVIAIIAILAAILFPVFARAREKARQNTCLSNVKQLTLGILMYASDYDGYYPFCLTGWQYGPAWKGQIYPYVKNSQIYSCPSQKVTNSAVSGDDIPGSSPLTKFPASYVANGGDNDICWYPGGAPMRYNGTVRPGENSRSDAEMERVAEVILITEGKTGWGIYWGQGPSSVAGGDQLWAGHSGQSNYGFCDGHAKALKPTATNNPLNLWTSMGADGPCAGQLQNCLSAVEAKWSG